MAISGGIVGFVAINGLFSSTASVITNSSGIFANGTTVTAMNTLAQNLTTCTIKEDATFAVEWAILILMSFVTWVVATRPAEIVFIFFFDSWRSKRARSKRGKRGEGRTDFGGGGGAEGAQVVPSWHPGDPGDKGDLKGDTREKGGMEMVVNPMEAHDYRSRRISASECSDRSLVNHGGSGGRTNGSRVSVVVENTCSVVSSSRAAQPGSFMVDAHDTHEGKRGGDGGRDGDDGGGDYGGDEGGGGWTRDGGHVDALTASRLRGHSSATDDMVRVGDGGGDEGEGGEWGGNGDGGRGHTYGFGSGGGMGAAEARHFANQEIIDDHAKNRRKVRGIKKDFGVIPQSHAAATTDEAGEAGEKGEKGEKAARERSFFAAHKAAAGEKKRGEAMEEAAMIASLDPEAKDKYVCRPCVPVYHEWCIVLCMGYGLLPYQLLDSK